jgi:HprK-related kinase B
MHETAAAWIEELSAPHAADRGLLPLVFEGCRIDLRSNSDELVRELSDYFKDFLDESGRAADLEVFALEAPEPSLPLDYTIKQPDPGKTKIKEEYVDFPDGRLVRKRLTGMHFLFTRKQHLAIGPCLENSNQVINFVNNRFIQHTLDGGYLLCHAAAVAIGARGLALAGRSGGGKSTLALELMRRNTTFVSNDRLMIQQQDEGLQMLGVAKLPRINPGTVLHNPALEPVMPEEERVRAAQLPVEELWDLEQKYDVYIEQCFGPGRYRLGARMAGLVLLNWERELDGMRIERVELAQRPDLVPLFRKEVGLFFLAGSSLPGVADYPAERYVEVMGDTPVFELSGGVDFDGATDACIKFLRDNELP